MPDLDAFVRFDVPTAGTIFDAGGSVLFEQASQYRRVASYGQIPPVIRNAILATEDKNFFSHSGIDYGVFPQVLWSNLWGAGGHRNESPDASDVTGSDRGFTLSQGGSTITHQLVRSYFLSDVTKYESQNRLYPGSRDGAPRCAGDRERGARERPSGV